MAHREWLCGTIAARRRFLASFAACLAIGAAGAPARASENLPPPQGIAVLVVDGGIQVTNAPHQAVFDLALLKSLPVTRFKSMTAWTDGESQFEGVRVRDLLARLGAVGTSVVATALDDYQITIPIADFQDYDVILAYGIDGKPLPPDNKGPLWIMYPFSEKPALQKDFYFSRCVWQLARLTVQ